MEIRRKIGKQVSFGSLDEGAPFVVDDGKLYVKGDETHHDNDSLTICMCPEDGYVLGFEAEEMVTPVKAHVVIEEG